MIATWRSVLLVIGLLALVAAGVAAWAVGRNWNSVQALNRTWLWLTAIAAVTSVPAVFGTAAAWVARYRILELQEESDRAKHVRDAELAHQKEQQEAALREKLLQSDERAAAAEQRLGVTESKLEVEAKKLELAKMEVARVQQELAPRHIDNGMRAALVTRLTAVLPIYTKFTERKNIRIDSLTEAEVATFAAELVDCFRQAGWEVNVFHAVYAPGFRGIAIDVGEAASQKRADGSRYLPNEHPVVHLASALQESGLKLANPEIRLHSGMAAHEMVIHVSQK